MEKGRFELLRESGAQLKVDEDGCLIRRSVLSGGLRVFTQNVPTARSVAVGAWVEAGSRDETAGHYGSTHYLEHLLFKGTQTRTARDIATAFDQVGGDSNAATAKEYTTYFGRVLAADLPMATGVIVDMVSRARLDEGDFEMERTVILDELAMAADDPTDLAHEKLATLLFGDTDLGRPIGGTRESVSATPVRAVREHYQQTYVPSGITFAAAGQVDHDQLCDLVLRAYEDGAWANASATNVPKPVRAVREPQFLPANCAHISRPLEQSHILLGMRSLPIGHEDGPVATLATTILGGGMSSRLFQEVREKRGLAYSTFAFQSAYSDAGYFGMYAGCSPTVLGEVEKVMRGELEDMAAGGVSETELSLALGQLKGSTALGLESVSARMNRLGRAEVGRHQLDTFERTMADLTAVTTSDVARYCATLANAAQMKVTVGPPSPEIKE
ncbi:MAG: pitrilysin family protein [Actinomycetaceae bacterium]|nr:pitrilysin family protein [Actinomycetaceae bacterium]